MAAAPPAVTVRKCRRAWSTGGILGGFVGGVLCTRSASAMEGLRWLGLEPGGRLNPSARLDFMVPLNMAKSIRVTTKKRRGRPATTGKGIQVGERWHVAELAAIDGWIASQEEELTRAQAIRRLVELGLKAKTKAAARADRAKELASKAIEKIIEPAAPPEEQMLRKQRLTKGPAEFRDERIDLPKRKR